MGLHGDVFTQSHSVHGSVLPGDALDVGTAAGNLVVIMGDCVKTIGHATS